MIKVDISNVWGQLSLPDLLAVEKKLPKPTTPWQTAPARATIFWAG